MNSSLSYTDASPVSLPNDTGREAQEFVGADRECVMTDEEREAAAYRAGVAMQAWYSTYQQSGNTADLDRAHYHLGQMRQILAGRSPEYVAKLEQERGLA